MTVPLTVTGGCRAAATQTRGPWTGLRFALSRGARPTRKQQQVEGGEVSALGRRELRMALVRRTSLSPRAYFTREVASPHRRRPGRGIREQHLGRVGTAHGRALRCQLTSLRKASLRPVTLSSQTCVFMAP